MDDHVDIKPLDVASLFLRRSSMKISEKWEMTRKPVPSGVCHD